MCPIRGAFFEKVKTCYTTRSKIVHGRSEKYPDIDEVMADTEAIVRTAFRKLLDPPTVLSAFISRERNEFLETWILSRSFDPPAMLLPKLARNTKINVQREGE
jgi:hypothetical protein